MTNYNDGKWHGWNGGECPVHSRTIVDVAHTDRGLVTETFATEWFWEANTTRIIAFRVVKEYRAPREWWICKSIYHPEGYTVVDSKYPDAIHVREVLE